MNIKIVTLNLCDLPIPLPAGILKHPLKKRVRTLLEQLNNSEVDIYCFQELFTSKTLKRIANVLTNYTPVFTQYFNLNKGGLVTFIKKTHQIQSYKFKTFENRKLYLQTFPDIAINKGFQIIDTDKFRIINAHLIESYNIKSVIGIQPLQLGEINSNIIDKTIICGDFNVTKTVQKSIFKNLNNVLENSNEPTITDDNPNRFLTKHFKPLVEQYDNIFHTKDIEKRSSEITFKTPYNNVVISDHYGVKAELTI